MYDETLDEETVRLYREVFSSPKGRLVLGHMLCELGYFDEVALDDKMGIALQNYAKHLLYRCGIIRADAVDEYVSLIFKIKYEPKGE